MYSPVRAPSPSLDALLPDTESPAQPIAMNDQSQHPLFDQSPSQEPIARSARRIRRRRKDPLVCTYEGCNKQFYSQSDLTRHIRVHTGEKPYVCPVCQKAFSQKGTLNRHKLLHESKSFKCSFNCGKTFTTSINCKQHERIHKNERPYVCTFPGCTNAYPSASSLNYHIKTHLGVRNYVCSCGKKFLTASNLNKHLKIRSHVKKYSCPLCSKEFVYPTDLNKHYAQDHKTITVPMVGLFSLPSQMPLSTSLSVPLASQLPAGVSAQLPSSIAAQMPPQLSHLPASLPASLQPQGDILMKYQTEIDRLKYENQKIISDNRQLAFACQQLQDMRAKSADTYPLNQPYPLLNLQPMTSLAHTIVPAQGSVAPTTSVAPPAPTAAIIPAPTAVGPEMSLPAPEGAASVSSSHPSSLSTTGNEVGSLQEGNVLPQMGPDGKAFPQEISI